MDDTTGVVTLREAWDRSQSEVLKDLAGFLPNLIGALLLLAAGLIIAKVIERLARMLLGKIRLDRLVGRTRARQWLGRGGVRSEPTVFLARILYWITLLLFGIASVQALGLDAVTRTLDRIIVFIPDIVGAVLILLLGLLLGRLAGNVVSSSAAAANLPQADRLGTAASSLVILVVVITALDQLGVETRLLGTLIWSLVVISGLTVGVTFALGAKDVLRNILAGHYVRQSFPVGSKVAFQEHRGVVAEIGPVSTLIRDGDRSWTVPNARLLETIVTR